MSFILKNSGLFRSFKLVIWKECLFCALFKTALFLNICGQSKPPVQDSTLSPLAQTKPKNQLVILPALVYTPETSLGFGGLSVYTFNLNKFNPDTRNSNVQAAFVYTLAGQVVSSIRYTLFYPSENFSQRGSWGYFKFPEYYYGIGNDLPESNRETVSYQIFSFENRFLKKVGKGIFLGIDQRYLRMWDVNSQEMGLIDSLKITGHNGFSAFGLGPAFIVDTRDNVNGATKGVFVEVLASFHNQAIGSKLGFNRYQLDARKYWSLDEKRSHILALQLRFLSSNGEVPFKQMAELGGDMIMRGYYRGRYRDLNILALQSEYRLPVWKWFGMVGFVGVGDVFSRLGAFNLSSLKPSYGLGLRFKLNKKENINARIDYGRGINSSGFYFGIAEAF